MVLLIFPKNCFIILLYLLYFNNVVTGNSPANSGDLGLSLGSSAASKLVQKALDSQLRSPRFVQIRLNSKEAAMFQDVAQINSQNRVDLGDLQVYFRDDQQIEMEGHNMKMDSTLLIKDVALPLFLLDQKKVLLHVEIKRAYIRLSIDRPASLRIEKCEIEHNDIKLKLEHSYLLNFLLNTFLGQIPEHFVRDRVCGLLLNTAINLRDKFTLQVSFKSLIPEKFIRYLLDDRVNLRSRVQSVNAADKQITVTAILEWASGSQITTTHSTNDNAVEISNMFNNSDNSTFNATDRIKESMEKLGELSTSSSMNKQSLISERMLLWVEDRLLNDLLKQFRWDSQWVNESIQLNSPRLPKETRAFFEVICPQCFFLFNISADGLPNVQIAPDNSILIKNRNRIAAAVLNPTLGQSGEKRTAIDLSMSLELKLVPEIQNGTFRTHLYLIERQVEVKNGSAFPSNMNKLVEQLIQDLIAEDIWPVLQRELEPLIYQSGIQLASRCGLDPKSAQLHFERSRLGVSARLDLEQVSFGQCFQQFKNGLPDASKLLMFNTLPKGPVAETA